MAKQGVGEMRVLIDERDVKTDVSEFMCCCFFSSRKSSFKREQNNLKKREKGDYTLEEEGAGRTYN